VVATQNADVEKVSPYECGFSPFNDARSAFDVRFYLVAILFIIFDLEIAFLFPWASLHLSEITIFGFWTMLIFLLHTNCWFYIRMEKRRTWTGNKRIISIGVPQKVLLNQNMTSKNGP
jgi:NADH:ubiquinone oxidoreductase subunit 3 (subunit A)